MNLVYVTRYVCTEYAMSCYCYCYYFYLQDETDMLR